jgi:hypothetical protein
MRDTLGGGDTRQLSSKDTSGREGVCQSGTRNFYQLLRLIFAFRLVFKEYKDIVFGKIRMSRHFQGSGGGVTEQCQCHKMTLG